MNRNPGLTGGGFTGTGRASVQVQVHGHPHDVPLSLVAAEVQRRGPLPRLPLLEAIIQHGERGATLVRLSNMLEVADPQPARPGSEHAAMHAALGLLRLSTREPFALLALSGYAGRLGGPAGAILASGVILLRDGPAPLCLPEADPLLVRQSTRALATIGRPADLVPGLLPLFSRFIETLQQAGKTLGVQAFRAYLGDVAEALYRLVQRCDPPPDIAVMLSETDRGYLADTLTFELPGTADFLAARQMVWLLPLLGLPDDAGTAAVERARDRFRNEAFHADCAIILAGGTWPPPRPAQTVR